MRVILFVIILTLIACKSEPVKQEETKKKPTKEEMCRDKGTSEVYKLFCN